MNIQPYIDLFISQLQQTTTIEWLAVAFSVAEVLLARVNNIWLYPTGIVGTVLSISILITAGLYAESALNFYYVIMSVYGWVHWIRKRGTPPVRISTASRNEWITTLVIVFLGWVVLYLLLKNFTPSTVPVWDAWVSSTAWAGMWLLARRKLENWVLLNISNIFAIPLLWHKQLVMFAVLTLILFVVAVFGFFDWLAIWRRERLENITSA